MSGKLAAESLPMRRTIYASNRRIPGPLAVGPNFLSCDIATAN